MFARYAYAPNALGYCGPSDGAALRGGPASEIRAVARRFVGAWPYLEVLAAMTGIADPLDHRLVESYWLGGGVGAHLDSDDFFAQLLAIIGPQAGHYWSHLTPELAGEATGNHCFHVFGVYPWSWLLGKGLGIQMAEQPVRILDSCRITPVTVVSREGDTIEVRCRRLVWDGRALSLSESSVHSVGVYADGYAAVPDVAPGDQIALHWGRVCGHLEPSQVQDVDQSTSDQLSVTNARLAAATRSR